MRMTIVVGILFLSFFFGNAAEAEDTINIVQLDPLSGPFKDTGDRAVMGSQFAVDQINAAGGLLGKKVKLLPEDSQLKPDVASRKASKAILQDGATFIFQTASTAVARALMEQAEKHKVIFVTFGALSDYLTGKEFNPYFFRTVPTTSNLSRTFAEFFKNQPYRKIYLINMDYAYGHAVADDFKATVSREIPDMKIVGEDYHPLATKDFGPYISKIISSGAEIVHTGNWGTDLEVLMKQGAQLGLKARFATYLLDDDILCSNLGNIAVGSYVVSMYLPTMDNQANKAFLAKWNQKYKDTKHPWPVFSSGWAYNGTMWLFEAIKKAGSLDPEAVIKAWEGMKYNGIVGEQVMRACDHQNLQAGLVAEVHPKSEFFEFPFPGRPVLIPVEKVTVPMKDTGNPRCR
jgi:branched-chain amino acid transport system substrate-binding protein